MRDAMLLAEAHHAEPALDAVSRFRRAWLVIKAGMNDAAVMPGLMGRQFLFRFDDDKRDVMSIQKRLRRGEADDAGADNRDIISASLMGDVKEIVHLLAAPKFLSPFILEVKNKGQWQSVRK